jgi:hypothetical protein
MRFAHAAIVACILFSACRASPCSTDEENSNAELKTHFGNVIKVLEELLKTLRPQERDLAGFC